MTITAPYWADTVGTPWPAPSRGAWRAARPGTSGAGALGNRVMALTRSTARTGASVLRLSPAAQVLTGLLLMAALQVAALPSQDPVHDVVSLLVYAPGGMVLFPLASGLIALAAFTWARQLSQSGRSWAARLATVAAASLLLLGAFPTDPPDIPGLSLSAMIHRHASLAMFIAIPAAAILTARAHTPTGGDRASRGRLRAVRVSVTICLLTAAPALVAVFPTMLPDAWLQVTLACDAVRGLVERIQLVTMTIIVILGVTLSRGAPEWAARAVAAPRGVIGGSIGNCMTGHAGWLDPVAAEPAGRKRGGLGPLSRAVPAATMVG